MCRASVARHVKPLRWLASLTIALLILAVSGPFAEAEKADPVYVFCFIHVEGFPYQAECYESVDRLLGLFEQHHIKPATVEMRDIAVRDMPRLKPELVERIKRMRIPINGNQETHIPWPSRNVDGLSWDEAVRKMLKFETGKLDLLTAEVDSSQPGGWLGLEQLFGITPLGPSIGCERGVSGYVTRQLRLSGAPYEISPHEEIPTDGITLRFGSRFNPEEWYISGDKAEAQGVPNVAPAKELELLLGRYPVKRIALRLEEQYLYCGPVGANVSAYPRGSDGLVKFPVTKVETQARLYTQEEKEAVWKPISELITYMAERPAQFKFIWADPQENQWKAGKIPERDFSKFPWVPPEQREISKEQLLLAARNAADYWKYEELKTVVSPLPDFVALGGDDSLSLAEAYDGFARALAHYKTHGSLPEKVTVRNILGPVDYRPSKPAPGLDVGARSYVNGEEVLAAAAKFAEKNPDRVPAEPVEFKVELLSRPWTRASGPGEMLMLMADELCAIAQSGRSGLALWRPASVNSSIKAFGLPQEGQGGNVALSDTYEQWRNRKKPDTVFYDIHYYKDVL